MGKAKIIAIGNPKGGVGKTTTAVNLAYVLARDSKVLVCDLDGSCNLSKFIPFYDADFCSAFDLITGAYGIGADGRRRLLTADEIIIHGDGNLDLLSGDRELTHLELTLAHKNEGGAVCILEERSCAGHRPLRLHHHGHPR